MITYNNEDLTACRRRMMGPKTQVERLSDEDSLSYITAYMNSERSDTELKLIDLFMPGFDKVLTDDECIKLCERTVDLHGLSTDPELLTELCNNLRVSVTLQTPVNVVHIIRAVLETRVLLNYQTSPWFKRFVEDYGSFVRDARLLEDQ